jgi:hypothetical protein
MESIVVKKVSVGKWKVKPAPIYQFGLEFLLVPLDDETDRTWEETDGSITFSLV